MDKKTFRINKLFESQFNTMGAVKTGEGTISTSAKAPKNVGKKKPPIIQHSKFTDDNMTESDFASLKKKSEKSGIDINILGEVFDRGIDSWSDDVELTPQQFAFNRVNSFMSEGKAFKEDDADLAEQVRTFGRRKTDGDSSFSNWKFDLGVGQRTKVLHGEHKGKRGEVLGKIDQKDGPVYRIKHDDGTIMKHHISTLDEPEDRRKSGLGTRRVSEDLEESNNTPHVRPHYGDGNNPKKQTAWKASNKHGKVKYFGLDFKSAASKHAGLVEESAMTHDELVKEMEKYDRVMDKFGGKLIHTTPKHPGSAVSGYAVGHDPKKDDHVIIRVDTASGIRKSGASKTVDHSVHMDHITTDHSKSKAMLGEQDDSPAKREVGTKPLVDNYKKKTPGESVAEEVMSADRKPMIVRPFKKEVVDPETGERKMVDVKGHSKTTPTKRRIIASGNLSDGKPAV